MVEPVMIFFYFCLAQRFRNLRLVNELILSNELLFELLDFLTLHIASHDKHILERVQAEIVVTLRGQLLATQGKEGHDLVGKHFGIPKTLRVEHHLSNEHFIWLRHGQTAEKLLQIVRQIRASRIARIHGDEDGHVWIDSDLFANHLYFETRRVFHVLQCLLDRLNLLGDGREHALLKTIELVETTPGAYLTQQR